MSHRSPPNWLHKKKFYHIQRSASPYKCDLGPSNALIPCPQIKIDDCQSRIESGHINLPRDVETTGWQVGLRNATNIDIFRTGYNRVWWTDKPNHGVRFGFPPNTMAETNPDYIYERTNEELENKFAFVVVPFAKSGEHGPGPISQQLRNMYNQSKILGEGYSGYPFGNPTVAPAHASMMWKSKIEVQIAATYYPQIIPSAADRTAFENDLSIPNYWKTNTDWNHWVSSSFHNKRFLDVAFNMWWPFGDQSINQLEVDYGQSVRDRYVKIEPSYNFYIRSYENFLYSSRLDVDHIDPGNTMVPETLLPNIYVLASEMDNRFVDRDVHTNRSSRFKKHINLVDDSGVEHISGIFQDILRTGTTEKVGEQDEGQYFEKWAFAMADVVSRNFSTSIFNNLKTSYNHLIFPRSNLDLLQNHQGDERLFPMHIKIEFATDSNTEVSDMFRDTKMSSFLLWVLQLGDATGNTTSHWSMGKSDWLFEDWDQVTQVACDYVNGYNDSKMFDLAALFYEAGFWQPGGVIYQTFQGTMRDRLEIDDRLQTFIGRYNEELAGMADPQNRLFVLLMCRVLLTKFSELMKPISQGGKFRSLQDILQGEMAYNETLAYKMTKRNEDTGKMHSIWFPNSSEIDVLSYIDTQVKPNTPYRYIIEAWQLVAGNETEYSVTALGGGTAINPSAPYEAVDDFNARLCISNESSLKLISVPYYDSFIDYPDGIRVVDRPPVRPDVNIIPYKGVPNKILLWLNGNVGDCWESPIALLPTDDFSTQLRFHGRDTIGDGVADEVNFRSDDHVTKFQVFRIDKRPRFYTDFSAATPMLVVADGATAASKVDDIEPNRKYYYTFRAIDNHGNVSNPSSVYEIEMVKSNDDLYFYISIINMDLDPTRQISKPARRYIQIKAAAAQVQLNETELATVIQNNGSEQEIRLFTADNVEVTPRLIGNNVDKHIWGEASQQKKFKIRLRSKQSGKKIDFNIQFQDVIGSNQGIPGNTLLAEGQDPSEEFYDVVSTLPGLEDLP